MSFRLFVHLSRTNVLYNDIIIMYYNLYVLAMCIYPLYFPTGI